MALAYFEHPGQLVNSYYRLHADVFDMPPDRVVAPNTSATTISHWDQQVPGVEFTAIRTGEQTTRYMRFRELGQLISPTELALVGAPSRQGDTRDLVVACPQEDDPQGVFRLVPSALQNHFKRLQDVRDAAAGVASPDDRYRGWLMLPQEDGADGLYLPTGRPNGERTNMQIIVPETRKALVSLAESVTAHSTAADVVSLERAHDQKLTLKNMSPDARAIVAEHGLFSTGEPRLDGFGEYLVRRRLERAHDKNTTRLTHKLAQAEEFKDAVEKENGPPGGTLGTRLIETFSTVTWIHGHNVRLKNPKKKSSLITTGDVVTSRMDFYVPTLKAKTDLTLALEAIFQSRGIFCGVDPSSVKDYPDAKETEGFVVSVQNMNEHVARAVGRAVAAAVARQDRAAGFTLPESKLSLEELEKNGETFPPVPRERLVGVDDGYQKLILTADYYDLDGSKMVGLQPRKKLHIDAVDSAPAIAGMRHIMNRLIGYYRGGRDFNQELDPNEENRVLLDEGSDLVRPRVTWRNDVGGPATAYVANTVQKIPVRAKAAWRKARQDKHHMALAVFDVAALFIGDVIGFGTQNAAALVLRYIPAATKSGWRLGGDYRQWKRYTREQHAKRAQLIEDLRQTG